MRIVFLSLVVALTGMGVSSAYAAETQKKAPVADSKAKTELVVNNPHIQEMNDQAKVLAKSLSPDEAEFLGQIRDNFGVLRSVDVARKSVADAVKLCADKNPDLKDAITKRHDTWDGQIGKAIDAQDKALDQEVTKDNFKNPAQIKAYLDTIDKAAHYADSHIEKKIITTPEACKNLMSSMDDTQKVILGMVNDMKWPDGKGAKTP